MKKLGKYEVLGELGHGAMGVVYRARDPIINRLVALKTITTGLADDPNLLQRFYREAQSAGGLQHPNIVTIYDMGEEQNLPYIAMELIEGESLEQIIIRRTNVPVTLKLTYALQACRAFDYAHKRGIVHRDIKPGNVMVNKEGAVKVVDFGIARILDTSKTQTGMLIGTFAYMSPEQYHGERADERSDIWSFGVLLYELLCYERPFTGENPASLMHSICSQEPRSLLERAPDCPPEIEKIISRVLRKSPQDRFQSMEDLQLELEPVYKQLQARSIRDLIDQSQQHINKGDFAQARELLRESLKVDSTNLQARNLLERVNAELKRLLIRPRVQQHVDKGRVLLDEGKIQEARAEAESALQLDSSFDAAHELQKQIQHELDRAQVIAEWLEAARQRLAEGLPEDAEALSARILDLDPSNKSAKVLAQQAAAEKAERLKRLHLLEKMREARSLWTQLNYDSCISLLAELHKEFPGEEEIQRLLDTVREDQAEQHRQKTMEVARNFLALGNTAQARALLVDLQAQFLSDDEIPRLLEDVRIEEAKQSRLRALAEARTCLEKKEYDKSIALLTALDEKFKNDPEISQLLPVAREDQAEQQRQQSISELQNLFASGRYDECGVLIDKLLKRFPSDEDILKLQRATLQKMAEEHKLEALRRAGDFVSNRHHEEAIALLIKLEKEFPADEAVIRSLATARVQEAEQQRQLGIAEIRNLLAAKRYDECHTLLARLQKRFPNDEDLGELQVAVRKDQEEQLRLASLANARDLLASRDYEQALTILAGIDKQYPKDEEIGRLIATACQGQREYHRQRSIAEGRSLLATRRYDECDALLAQVEREFPADSEIAEIRNTVQRERAEQEKLGGLAKARNLLAKQNYNECTALLIELGKKFPGDEEIPKLLASARGGLAEQRKLKILAEARNLVALKRFDESISLLLDLNKEFPDELVSKLLANARKEQAEQQKQQELTHARALVAAQQLGEALALLDTLAPKHPKDTAVQKLYTLVKHEREKQTRSERLQHELESLKKLISEKNYSEILSRAELSKAEFPGDADLLRLIDFARSQQAQIESERRLQNAIAEVKALTNENDFADALRVAEAALKVFPEHTELASLRNRAKVQEKKQRTRGLIEQRIREIKFKINRENFSEAIDLANETIAVTGPDTDLTQLLNSATVEFRAREKKRLQEQKLQEIRTLLETGNIDQAATSFQDAVETETLDPFDARVSRVANEIDLAKDTPPVASAALSTFSNEYAFSQGPPAEVAPPGPEKATDSVAHQASLSQLAISPQPVMPMPVPENLLAQPNEQIVQGFVTPPADSATLGTSVPALVGDPLGQLAVETTSAVPARNFRKPVRVAGIAAGIVLLVWASTYFVSSHKKVEQPASQAAVTKATPDVPKPVRAAPVAPKTPADPVEDQQRNAIAGSDKLIASGDLKGALQALQGAEKLNGPLTAEIKQREDSVGESMKNQSLAKLRQQEAALWQQARDEVDKGQFDAAKRDLRKLQASTETGIRRVDIQNYLDDVIPKRQKEEDTFRQAQQVSQASNPRGLQEAVELYSQVIALNGPRRAEAEQLTRTLESRLNTLKQENARKEIAALESAARQNIQQADFNSARQKVDQIRQAGGDASVLSNEIYQAQVNQARLIQQQKEAQKAVQVPDTTPAPAPPPEQPPKAEPPSLMAADQGAIQSVLQRFLVAFEQRDVNAVRQVWPGIPPKTYTGYKSSFEGAAAIQMVIVNSSLKIDPEGSTATLSAQLEQQYTPRGQKTMVHRDPWVFQLAKKHGVWTITGVR